MCERCDAVKTARTYSNKYRWYQDVATFIDIQYFQTNLAAAVKEHNEKMSKYE